MRISDWSSDVCSSDLHARLALIDPVLDLRRRKIELSARLRNRGLALDDLQYQRRLPARCPTLDFFFITALIDVRSEEHTSELQSLMRISYAVFCLKKKNKQFVIRTKH